MLRLLPRLFDIDIDELGNAGDERMFEPFLDRGFTPGEILFLASLALPLKRSASASSRSVRIRAAIQHDIFAGLAQLRIYIFIDGELAGIDDAHVHARFDRMIEKDRMHGLAHKLIATERKREIGDAAGNMDEREALYGSPARPR